MPTATEVWEPQVEDRVQVRGPARGLRRADAATSSPAVTAAAVCRQPVGLGRSGKTSSQVCDGALFHVSVHSDRRPANRAADVHRGAPQAAVADVPGGTTAPTSAAPACGGG